MHSSGERNTRSGMCSGIKSLALYTLICNSYLLRSGSLIFGRVCEEAELATDDVLEPIRLGLADGADAGANDDRVALCPVSRRGMYTGGVRAGEASHCSLCSGIVSLCSGIVSQRSGIASLSATGVLISSSFIDSGSDTKLGTK